MDDYRDLARLSTGLSGIRATIRLVAYVAMFVGLLACATGELAAVAFGAAMVLCAVAMLMFSLALRVVGLVVPMFLRATMAIERAAPPPANVAHVSQVLE